MNPIILIICAVVVLLPVVYVLVQFNALVALRNYIRESWSDVDVELKRRYDLIPNLVAVVKGYAAHEKETLEGVIQARNQAVGAQQNQAAAGGPPPTDRNRRPSGR